MRFGYWMPIFGGWLRNVPDEGMPVAWPYLRDLAIESEQHGFGLSLIAELNLMDVAGYFAPDEPALGEENISHAPAPEFSLKLTELTEKQT